MSRDGLPRYTIMRRRIDAEANSAGGASTAECGQDEPCGSWRVILRDEGSDVRVVWCDRVHGPCPFPGTPETKTSSRKCADSPGRRLNVVYADALVVEARDRLRRYVATGNPPPHLADALHVAVAALTTCIGSEEDPGI